MVIGISPGNRYFSVPMLTELFRWADARFRRVDTIVPDSTLPHNYRALGYPEHRAARKAHAETSAVRNRIARAWAASGVPAERRHDHLLSELVSHPDYRRLHMTAQAALREDPLVRRTADSMIREFLRRQLGGIQPDDRQVAQAQQYLCAELPVLLGSATIFRTSSSLNFYHRAIPLTRLIYQESSSLRASLRQGYAIVRPSPERF